MLYFENKSDNVLVPSLLLSFTDSSPLASKDNSQSGTNRTKAYIVRVESLAGTTVWLSYPDLLSSVFRITRLNQFIRFLSIKWKWKRRLINVEPLVSHESTPLRVVCTCAITCSDKTVSYCWMPLLKWLMIELLWHLSISLDSTPWFLLMKLTTTCFLTVADRSPSCQR